MQLDVLCKIAVCVTTTIFSDVIHGLISPKLFRHVIMNITAVQDAGSVVEQHTGIGSIMCAAIARINYTTFCAAHNGDCLIVNETFPAYYDDGTPDNGYDCHTSKAPLIDYAAAMANCGPGFCCPLPFVEFGSLGCVYLNPERLVWKDAVKMCKEFWPTSHIYMGNTSADIRTFIQSKGVGGVWIGAHWVSANNRWEFLNGARVVGNWDWFEPGIMNIWIGGPPGPWECALQRSGSGWCDMPCGAEVESLCIIEP
ncbi:uncharacterized protein LOC108667267 [Hyalella azteca]|uniref:Uncharacterized protein LOC108667267 n=1 Tax=Hyalella azteca TaxID=294128 RepID=A0A8B7N795_HYAAZ|nr:uncharacterized protein LOC108667267 [Hyalella azteca]